MKGLEKSLLRLRREVRKCENILYKFNSAYLDIDNPLPDQFINYLSIPKEFEDWFNTTQFGD